MASSSFSLPNQITGTKFSGTTPPSQPGHVNFRYPLRISAASAIPEKACNGPDPQMTSLYEVLGIQMGASYQQVKIAYRNLARILHPDVASEGRENQKSTADEFVRVQIAYATLSDPEKRASYDRTLLRQRFPVRLRHSLLPESGFSGYTCRKRTWETDQCW
ncbi:Chaperone protein dnaJ 11 [Forsythia ovata]|uniref:Chaperone protein dnaJ 11 n=1 Tax=Forsythia ovata TaxID=205694 RepID=A0ABD1UB40_9LAMI